MRNSIEANLLDSADTLCKKVFTAYPNQLLASHVCGQETKCDQGCIELSFIRMELLGLMEAVEAFKNAPQYPLKMGPSGWMI